MQSPSRAGPAVAPVGPSGPPMRTGIEEVDPAWTPDKAAHSARRQRAVLAPAMVTNRPKAGVDMALEASAAPRELKRPDVVFRNYLRYLTVPFLESGPVATGGSFLAGVSELRWPRRPKPGLCM